MATIARTIETAFYELWEMHDEYGVPFSDRAVASLVAYELDIEQTRLLELQCARFIKQEVL